MSVLILATGYVTPLFASAAADFDSPFATTASTNCDVRFGPSMPYATGRGPSIALHRSGLVLEYHWDSGQTGLWYRVAKLNGTGVTWGQSQKDGGAGYDPAIAISKEGYVLVVHGDRSCSCHKNGSHLYYRVGWLDPYGDQNQTISWKTDRIHWDAGFSTLDSR
jgi:hypothetical protein